MRPTVCRGRRALLWIALAVLPFWAAQQSQATDLALQDAAAMAGTGMFLNSGAPGLIIAVVKDDDSFIAGFGETAPGNNTEPDGKSIFRLGSISKVFAGDLLARMAADGRIGLTDPLSRRAPEGAPLKAFANQPITLLDLATHGAGLPRELRDPIGKSEEGSDAFLVSQPDYYWTWLRQNAPAYAPGTTAMYSNVGFGLLGEALAKAGGKPFGALLQAEITAPLGLGDTVTALSDQQKSRLMVGLDPFDKPDPNLEVPPVTIASGGVYSTAEDMVRWMRWHLQPTPDSAATLALATRYGGRMTG
jgi:D-alanyl-D-alanine-carboxypeptidase/D-alanyl-D-alanine-endopeptidase